jgi:hypothetical protein
MDTVLETFVDACGEISLKHGMIRIELVSLSGPEPRVMQRLIMNLQAFSHMVQAQNGMLGQLEKAGAIRLAQPAPEADAAPERGGVVAPIRRLAIEPAPQPATPPAAVGGLAPQPMTDLAPPRSPNFSE